MQKMHLMNQLMLEPTEYPRDQAGCLAVSSARKGIGLSYKLDAWRCRTLCPPCPDLDPVLLGLPAQRSAPRDFGGWVLGSDFWCVRGTVVCVQFLPAIWQGRPSVLSESSPHENILMFRELQRLISDLEQIFTALTETSALTSSFPVSQSLMREIPA